MSDLPYIACQESTAVIQQSKGKSGFHSGSPQLQLIIDKWMCSYSTFLVCQPRPQQRVSGGFNNTLSTDLIKYMICGIWHHLCHYKVIFLLYRTKQTELPNLICITLLCKQPDPTQTSWILHFAAVCNTFGSRHLFDTHTRFLGRFQTKRATSHTFSDEDDSNCEGCEYNALNGCKRGTEGYF